MKVLKVSVSCGATVNLGNYESARCDVCFEVAPDPVAKEDCLTAIKQASKEAIQTWVQEIQAEAGVQPKSPSRFTG